MSANTNGASIEPVGNVPVSESARRQIVALALQGKALSEAAKFPGTSFLESGFDEGGFDENGFQDA